MLSINYVESSISMKSIFDFVGDLWWFVFVMFSEGGQAMNHCASFHEIVISDNSLLNSSHVKEKFYFCILERVKENKEE